MNVVIHVIQGRADMPANDRAYQISRSLLLLLNREFKWLFRHSFSGNALLISRNTAMLTAINKFEAKMVPQFHGSSSSQGRCKNFG